MFKTLNMFEPLTPTKSRVVQLECRNAICAQKHSIDWNFKRFDSAFAFKRTHLKCAEHSCEECLGCLKTNKSNAGSM